jgi:hypothetical protein
MAGDREISFIQGGDPCSDGGIARGGVSCSRVARARVIRWPSGPWAILIST